MTAMVEPRPAHREPVRHPQARVIDRQGFDLLLQALLEHGYALRGPRVQEQAIVYDEIESSQDLPIGLRDEQNAGSYRLRRRGDEALFGYVVGPHAWKKFLFPPAQKLYSVTRNGAALDFTPHVEAPQKLAFIGARACELAAIAIQDRVFLEGPYVDPGYAARRKNVFIAAVHCTEPGGTCFCDSMNTGPRALADFDLALTEMLGPQRHEFLVEVGTDLGRRMIENIPGREATGELFDEVDALMTRAAGSMKRSLDTRGIRELLYRHVEDRHWDKVAKRCLSCANCTMVCPTCFCSTVEDTTDLTGDHAERWRKWDSCFNADFSYIHGGAIRSSIRARYRQWMTHKLASWQDQFGTSGCVGCGRCITWCPVGIDITEEAAALRAGEATPLENHEGTAP